MESEQAPEEKGTGWPLLPGNPPPPPSEEGKRRQFQEAHRFALLLTGN